MEVNLPVLLRFTFYLRAIFQIQAPGTSIWRGDLTEGFCLTGLAGLYLEGLVHGTWKLFDKIVIGQEIVVPYLDVIMIAFSREIYSEGPSYGSCGS